MYGHTDRKKGRFKKIAIVIILPFLLLLLSYGAYKVFFIPAPEISGLEQFSLLPKKKNITLTAKNIQKLQIALKQGRLVKTIIDFQGDEVERLFEITVKPKELGLHDGSARLFVYAKNGLLKKKELILPVEIDTRPPVLQIIRSPFQLKSGSTGLALLKAKGADRVYIKENENIFTAYKLKDSPNEYVVIFPARYDIERKTVFYAVAEDRAGNQTIKSLRTRVVIKNFRHSNIRINDDFINRVVYPLLGETEVDDPVEAFKTVNEKWRKRDTEQLHEIGMRSADSPLWKGAFLQLKNSKVMAKYGDKRTYIYNGRPISKSIHLGYDLASVSNAPVPAANSGRVVYADDLGIYGNAVVIDHGLGLMSLYGHMSEIRVTPGQDVKKGEIIGYTGSTGFAGGDHLHFGILVQGFEVSPLYFWDARWVRNNLEIQ
ncbi:MAG: M23 family metallopeptidase [Nitrospirae bacterium]|nr:M23 family metallopeptidase [Nitrospirota bacterium]